jgi:RNA polymerase sigma-70 factor (ECF subfamily)
VEGYTHREIAEMMGNTESFSKSQLSRAYQRLRPLLDGELERRAGATIEDSVPAC